MSGGAGVRVHPWEGVGTCGVMRRVGAWAGGGLGELVWEENRF